MRVWFAVMLLAASPVQAHCYSVWRYKTPQHCGVGGPHARVAVARVAVREDEPLPTPRPVGPLERPDIPLPDIDSPTTVDPPSDEKDKMLRALGIEMLKRQIGQSPLSGASP